MKYPEHATLITGQLNSIEYTHMELRKIKDSTIFFLNTGENSRILLNQYLTFINNYIISDPNDFYQVRDKLGFGDSLMQWWRLNEAIDLMYQWEERNNHRFKFIHKIRVDNIYNDIEKIYSSEHVENMNKNNALYINSDISFGGRREFFCVLQKLYEFIKSNPFSTFHYSLPPNLDQLEESSPLMHASFHLSSNNLSIEKRNTIDIDNIKNIYPQNRDQCLNFYKDFFENNKEYTTSYGPIGTFPEHYFARFLNLVGVRSKSIHGGPYSSRLLIERLIKSDSDVKLIHAIRNKDYKFLDDYSWNNLSVKWIQSINSEVNFSNSSDEKFILYVFYNLLKAEEVSLFGLRESIIHQISQIESSQS